MIYVAQPIGGAKAVTRRINARRSIYDRVLLAVYLLADDDGKFCVATCDDVARQAGVSTSTAWRYLNELHVDEVINIRGRGGYYPRLLLLLDHPDNAEFIPSRRARTPSAPITAQES